MSARAWYDAAHPPRHYAAAILEMDDKARQRAFFDTHVPDHLKDIVMEHVISALAVGGKR